MAAAKALFAQGLVERRLGGQNSAGNRRRPAPGRARLRNVLAPHHPARERFLQAIRSFRDHFGERVTIRECLVEVREGDLETAFAFLVEVDGVAVSSCHDRNFLKVVRVDAELLAHAEKRAGLEGLPAVLHHGAAIAAIQGAVAPFEHYNLEAIIPAGYRVGGASEVLE